MADGNRHQTRGYTGGHMLGRCLLPQGPRPTTGVFGWGKSGDIEFYRFF